MRGKVLRYAVIAGSLGFAVGFASLVFTAVIGSNLAADDSSTVVPGVSGVNASGQSYGPWGGLEFEPPDLIEAYATNGKIGYVRADELLVEPPSSLEEALNHDRKDIVLDVVLQDRRTPIGVFAIIGNPEVIGR